MDGELKAKNSGAYRGISFIHFFPHPSGTINTLVTIYTNEGVRGLQSGLPIAVVREGTKNLFRIGMTSSSSTIFTL